MGETLCGLIGPAVAISCREITVSKDQVVHFDNGVIVVALARARADEPADQTCGIVRLVSERNRIEKQFIIRHRRGSRVADALRWDITLDDLHRGFTVTFITPNTKTLSFLIGPPSDPPN